jgi:hypothetical protein
MTRIRTAGLLIGLLALAPAWSSSGDKAAGDKTGVVVDKAKRTITIDAKIAPRKLEHLKGEIYPIEVIACWPHPKGKKAHETVVTIEAKPSDVHKALVGLGLKPGTPRMGDTKEEPQGPECKIYLDLPSEDGGTKRIPIEKSLVDKKNGKPLAPLKWRFTGSVMVQPDPEKDDTMYGADMSGTLITIFPVTNQCVFQTHLTLEYEKFLKLETNTKVLPKEGTPVKLVIEVAAK